MMKVYTKTWALILFAAHIAIGGIELYAQDLPVILQGHTAGVSAVAASPDGKLLASSGLDGKVRLWNTGSSTPLEIFSEHSDEVYDVRFSSDGRWIASTGYDRKVVLYDVSTKKVMRVLTGLPSWSVSIAFSPESKELAALTMAGKILVWDVASGELKRTIRSNEAMTLDWSSQGVLACGGGAALALRDITDGSRLQNFGGYREAIWKVVFSADGRLLASAAMDKTARIWRTDNGELMQTLTLGEQDEHSQKAAMGVTAVAFSPDGKRLVTGGVDQNIRLWDVASGKLLHTYSGHTASITGLAFLPDGGHIVSASLDRTIRIWRIIL